jgi:uncharacterized protein
MSTTLVPDEMQCIALLKKHGTPQHIILHSQKVWDVAQLLGEGLLRRGHSVDMALLRASCLLHDIGKYPCILDGSGYHDVRGEQIMLEEGHPQVARIIVQHVILRVSREDPVREEHVLYYSDKRVVHDEIVSLEKRFVYLEETYGRNPEALHGLSRMKDETLWLEEQIFALVDFEPRDVVDLVRANLQSERA